MVKAIYFLKPAWCGNHLAGLWPEAGLTVRYCSHRLQAVVCHSLPLSTAWLYTLTQPGHSLWSLGQSNPFDPKFLASPSTNDTGSSGKNQVAGGLIFFGGGVPLYSGGQVIGGLGVSGDTSCADHEIAKRVRHMANLDPPGGPLVDDITYTIPDGPSIYAHPRCFATFRNGVALGTEASANSY